MCSQRLLYGYPRVLIDGEMTYRLDSGTLSWKEGVERQGDWILDTLVGWLLNYIAIFVIRRRLLRIISVLR
ncbi:hypothetical protein BDN67DRAFT_491503 [Paxillus ammoniavirescens]|nr:hypothetical protein BDN67DRAFT_491503 [Paxillus ammoniavirescens]